jgi:hypothetical protein
MLRLGTPLNMHAFHVGIQVLQKKQSFLCLHIKISLNCHITALKFVFLHMSKNVYFFLKTFCASINCPDVM